jgi:hypothetical protein
MLVRKTILVDVLIDTDNLEIINDVSDSITISIEDSVIIDGTAMEVSLDDEREIDEEYYYN